MKVKCRVFWSSTAKMPDYNYKKPTSIHVYEKYNYEYKYTYKHQSENTTDR